MGFGGKNRKSPGKRPRIPHHPRARARARARAEEFEAAMRSLDEAAERALRSIAQFAYIAQAVRRTHELLSRVMLGRAEMGEDGAIRFRPFMPAFTTRIGVKP